MNTPTTRGLPSVHALIDHPALAGECAARGRSAVVTAIRAELAETRAALLGGRGGSIMLDDLVARIAARLANERRLLRPVVNATGILLHTGLGRSPLAAEAIAAIGQVAAGYCNLEIDLDSGERGNRASGVESMLRELTGAEAATVVNNNAAATILSLKALAAGREVVVSRGQLVEIGGSFRLPEILAVSGATLREVGTTNKTRVGDYANAIGPQTAGLLRVHASNYQIVGFAEDVAIDDLALLAKSRGIWAIDDIGSGAIDEGRPPVSPGEPTLLGSLRAGADLVLCSGDKLLGGPQCGVITGSRQLVGQIVKDPLMRAFRVDKLTLAALEATLRLCQDRDRGQRRIPLWSFLCTPAAELQGRAERLCERLAASGWNAEAIATEAFVGGGSVPAAAIPSYGVRVSAPFPASSASVGELARSLRTGDPAAAARIHAGSLILDLRAVAPGDDRLINDAFAALESI